MSVGKGWAKLVEPVVDRAKEKGVAIYQIKEKFGGLRIYAEDDAEIDTLIKAAAVQAVSTCERCGAVGKLRLELSWVKTLCSGCMPEKERA